MMVEIAAAEGSEAAKPVSRLRRLLPAILALAITAVAFAALDILLTHVSYALILEARRGVEVGDSLTSPAP